MSAQGAGEETPGALQPSPRRWDPLSIAVGAGLMALCVTMQAYLGSFSADFTGFADEPSHFVGAVMIRDWLASRQWLAPLAFADSYYSHYPYFAVGYWPPLFTLVTGFWMLLVGAGRAQALLVPAACAAGTGWLIFALVRKHAGRVWGVGAAAVYLMIPTSQRAFNAVMVDPMTTFLCLASAACAIRYLNQPSSRRGILGGITCGLAVLSKYNAAYVTVLTFAVVLLLGRTSLLKRWSFWIQPVIVTLMVGPWAFWTRKLTFYGLPFAPEALTVHRAIAFLGDTFRVFPPLIMGVIILGLIAMLLRPKLWDEDFLVLGLLLAGHLALLIASPVGSEKRYFLLPAAVLSILAFRGWAGLLAAISGGKLWRVAVQAMAAVLSLALVISQIGAFSALPKSRIPEVVAAVLREPSFSGGRVVVPGNLEGPFIAEFASQSRHRLDHYLLRPGKLLARQDWFGDGYSPAYQNAGEMVELFRRSPVQAVVWNEAPDATGQAHGQMLREVLQDSNVWRPVLTLGPSGDSASSWTVYAYRSPGKGAAADGQAAKPN